MSVEKKTDSTVLFTYETDKPVRKVFLAGDFNGWEPDARRMVKSHGKYRARMKLPAGEYRYKFVVDGAWYHDDHAPMQVRNSFGTLDSVARV